MTPNSPSGLNMHDLDFLPFSKIDITYFRSAIAQEIFKKLTPEPLCENIILIGTQYLKKKSEYYF